MELRERKKMGESKEERNSTHVMILY